MTRSRAGALPAYTSGLTLALFAAGLLRFYALGAHLPFSPGVDEPEIMERAVRMMKTGDFNPHFFDYPSLYMYVEAVASTLRFLTGALRGEWSGLAQAPTEEFYLWGRAVTALLGTATVWLVYRAGLRWGARTALLASVMFAVMPLHVRESHYTLTDVPATFFVMITLLLSLRAHERSTGWSFALAGAAAGLAGATKYNAGLAIVLPLIACAMTPATRPSRALALLWTVLGMLIAFLLAAPYTLFDLPHFLNGFAYLAAQYHVPRVGGDPIWLTALKGLRNALEWPGSLIVLAGLGVGVARVGTDRDRLKWVLATAFPVIYFVFVVRQNLFYARYLMPLIPFLSLLGAAGIVWFVDVAHWMRLPRLARRTAIVILTLVAIVPPTYASIQFNTNEGRVWTTEQLYRWIRQTLPKGTAIRFEGSVTIHLPPDYTASYMRQLRTEDLAGFRRDGIQYLVASSQVFGPYLEDPGNFPEQNRDYRDLFARAQEVARFTATTDHPGPEFRVLRVTSTDTAR
jgi:4-amino-4-deoxy-L-arabinose transferase-like glycosyltransferase